MLYPPSSRDTVPYWVPVGSWIAIIEAPGSPSPFSSTTAPAKAAVVAPCATRSLR